MSSEEWRPIADHLGYEVSNLGRVRSVDRTIECGDGRTRRFRGSLLKGHADKRMGYHRVVLYDRSLATARTVHSLVAEAFLGSRPEGQEVRHRNGDTSDNRATNLVYGTRSQNMQDSLEHGTHANAAKEVCRRGHRLVEPNLVVSKLAKGSRDCLACARARAFVCAHPELNFIELSDKYFIDIMGEPV